MKNRASLWLPALLVVAAMTATARGANTSSNPEPTTEPPESAAAAEPLSETSGMEMSGTEMSGMEMGVMLTDGNGELLGRAALSAVWTGFRRRG